MHANEIRRYIKLMESTNLTEAYEDSIRRVADSIAQQYKGRPISKEDLIDVIQREKSQVPMGSLNPTEYVKDVLRLLKGQVTLQRSGVVPNQERLAKLDRAIKMVERSMENIPDGLEPIDHIIEKHNRYGFTDHGNYDQPITTSDDFHLWMNLAAKVILDGNQYNKNKYARYISPGAMKAADRSGWYSQLIDETIEAFKSDHPELARNLGF